MTNENRTSWLVERHILMINVKNVISLKLNLRATVIALKLQIWFCQDSWWNTAERPYVYKRNRIQIQVLVELLISPNLNRYLVVAQDSRPRLYLGRHSVKRMAPTRAQQHSTLRFGSSSRLFPKVEPHLPHPDSISIRKISLKFVCKKPDRRTRSQ